MIGNLRPALSLHFGVARDATGFRIERIARNACGDALDATGCGPPAPFNIHGGPHVLPAGIDVAKVIHRLARRGLPVTFSDDAGGYLCNAAFYHALEAAARAERPCRAGFIHIRY